MKKLISILMALSASLIITTAASAVEAPEVSIEATAIPAEEIGDYGEVEGHDAYLLNVKISGVDAERTSANTATGRVMAPFSLSLTTDGMDLIDWDNSYMFESTLGAEVAPGNDGFNIEFTANPARTTGFPAKGETVVADETYTIATMLMYIPAGESIELNVAKLSLVFSTYASGKITDSTLTKTYNMANPESPVICNTKSITVGEKATEPDVKYAPEYFSANLTYAKTAMDKNGMIQFTFEETTDDSTVTKYADYDFGKNFPNIESGTNLTLNIKVDGVPSTVDSLVLKGATWGIQAENPAN